MLIKGLAWIEETKEQDIDEKLQNIGNEGPNSSNFSKKNKNIIKKFKKNLKNIKIPINKPFLIVHSLRSKVSYHNLPPPTKIKTNEVTWSFQEIVNTYGIPNYKEINPGLFTVATFPFLYGMMFGDMGHGSILLIFAIYLFCHRVDPN